MSIDCELVPANRAEKLIQREEEEEDGSGLQGDLIRSERKK